MDTAYYLIYGLAKATVYVSGYKDILILIFKKFIPIYPLFVTEPKLYNNAVKMYFNSPNAPYYLLTGQLVYNMSLV